MLLKCHQPENNFNKRRTILSIGSQRCAPYPETSLKRLKPFIPLRRLLFLKRVQGSTMKD